MQVPDVSLLSLGQWAAICRGWNQAHDSSIDPPSIGELEDMMLAVRRIVH